MPTTAEANRLDLSTDPALRAQVILALKESIEARLHAESAWRLPRMTAQRIDAYERLAHDPHGIDASPLVADWRRRLAAITAGQAA